MKPWEQKPTWYAGIGSRETPASILTGMQAIAIRLRNRRWMLRSGGARGADLAFETGARPHFVAYETRRGWRTVTKRPGGQVSSGVVLNAERVACFHHPRWHSLGINERMLHTRNVFQVLGEDRGPNPAEPEWSERSGFVLCWTPDGATLGEETTERTGGTGQAIRIASYHQIPVYNLQREDHRALWSDWGDDSIKVW